MRQTKEQGDLRGHPLAVGEGPTDLPAGRIERDVSAAGAERHYPLAGLDGVRPSAPGWFEWAVSQQPSRRMVNVDGVAIESLSWGNPDAPGLLLMHGQSAHAGWWRHVAPFLTRERHVVALSWSGMGRSSWRDLYSTGLMEREAIAAMQAFGFFERKDPPLIVGHSLGGVPCIALAARADLEFAGAVAIDTGVSPRRNPRDPSATHSSKIYPSMASALARFRFVSSAGNELAYVADLFARDGLVEIDGPDGQAGWQWSFDPSARSRFEKGELPIGAVRCPLSLIYGDASVVVPEKAREEAIRMAPAGTKVVFIPDCGHHVMAEQPLALIAALQALASGR